jgi:hypothetical protein
VSIHKERILGLAEKKNNTTWTSRRSKIKTQVIKSYKMMDVTLNAGAVNTPLAALFDFLLFGVTKQIGIDHLPSGSQYSLNVLLRMDFLNPLSAMPMRQNQISDWESTRWKAKSL